MMGCAGGPDASEGPPCARPRLRVVVRLVVLWRGAASGVGSGFQRGRANQRGTARVLTSVCCSAFSLATISRRRSSSARFACVASVAAASCWLATWYSAAASSSACCAAVSGLGGVASSGGDGVLGSREMGEPWYEEAGCEGSWFVRFSAFGLFSWSMRWETSRSSPAALAAQRDAWLCGQGTGFSTGLLVLRRSAIHYNSTMVAWSHCECRRGSPTPYTVPRRRRRSERELGRSYHPLHLGRRLDMLAGLNVLGSSSSTVTSSSTVNGWTGHPRRRAANPR